MIGEAPDGVQKPLWWEDIWTEVHHYMLVFGSLSLVFCLLTCVLCWKFPRLCRMPGDLVFNSYFCELVVSVGFVALVLDNKFNDKVRTGALCGDDVFSVHPLVLLSIVFFETCASAFRLAMYFHALGVYLNPFRPDRRSRLYPCIAASSGCITAGCCSFFFHRGTGGTDFVLCGQAYYDTIAMGLFIVPFCLHFVLGGVFDLFIRVLVLSADRRARRREDPASISFLARQRVMRHSTAYLLLYGFQLALGLVCIGLLHFGTSRELVPIICAFMCILACGRPTISFAGWLIINDIVYILFGCCSFFKRASEPGSPHREIWCREQLRGPGLSELPISQSPQLRRQNTARSISEMLVETPDMPLRTLSGASVEEAGQPLERSQSMASEMHLRSRSLLPGEMQQRLEVVRDAMSIRANTVQGIDEVGFKEELRFELLYYVAHGIGEDVQKELLSGQRQSGAGADGGGGGASSSSSASPAQGPAASPRPPREPELFGSFNLSNLARRSRASVLRAATMALLSGTPDRHTRATSSGGGGPLLEVTPLGLVRSYSNGDQRRPTQLQPAGFPTPQVNHYGKDIFREIRTAFGISQSAFASEFPNNVNKWDRSWQQRLKESVSEGASGSFFYRVMNNSTTGVNSRFIIKQITIEEKRTLMAFLPAYHAHVRERQGRSLIQYLGCYSMSLWWQWSGKVYFVVMRNFLPVRQWLTFDLKGATANRRALDPRVLHHIHAGEDLRSRTAWGTLRDWEWMDIAMVCDVSPEDKAKLVEMILADAALLASEGLMDYSLLVGIHRVSPEASSNEREARLRHLTAAGGYISIDRQKVYFFGIIDVLEPYDCGWRVQHAALTSAYCLGCKCAKADGISAMPPHEYAERFSTFVVREVLNFDSSQVTRPMSPSVSAIMTADEDERQPSSVGPSRADPGPCCCSGCFWRATDPGPSRWVPLWERRRRGLIRERIEAEWADHMRRIADLEAQVPRPRPLHLSVDELGAVAGATAGLPS